MRMCSGIYAVDDDVHGSIETLCNFFFALGTPACCRAEARWSVVLGIRLRGIESKLGVTVTGRSLRTLQVQSSNPRRAGVDFIFFSMLW